jgi:hypothetical protein
MTHEVSVSSEVQAQIWTSFQGTYWFTVFLHGAALAAWMWWRSAPT